MGLRKVRSPNVLVTEASPEAKRFCLPTDSVVGSSWVVVGSSVVVVVASAVVASAGVAAVCVAAAGVDAACVAAAGVAAAVDIDTSAVIGSLENHNKQS